MSGKKTRILFITTLNLATNPRLVKEIELALKEEYDVDIICFEFNNWSYKNNLVLKEKLKRASICSIPAGRELYFQWFFSTINEKLCRFLGRFISLPEKMLSQAVSRRSTLLIKKIKQSKKPDLIIAHNPGALYPSLWAARYFCCSFGFDVEDYHPGEGHNRHLQMLQKMLVKKVLPKANYVSFASPLIRKNILTDCNTAIDPDQWVTVLNSFPSSEFMDLVINNDRKLNLVWFSQNINSGRGLELIIPIIDKYEDLLTLNLFGNLKKDFFEAYLKNKKGLKLHGSLTQNELHKMLAQFDIGLAIEPGKDLNNQLAVSNKLIAYLQSGLYVIASNTQAQQSFLNSFPEHGICFDLKNNNFEQVLIQSYNRLAEIRNNKKYRYNHFQKNNWENESQKLSDVWRKLICEKNSFNIAAFSPF